MGVFYDNDFWDFVDYTLHSEERSQVSRKKSQGSVIWPLCQNERQVVELRDEKFKSEAIQEKVHKLFRKFSTNIHYLFQQNIVEKYSRWWQKFSRC